jgi:glycerophosphoryl diester phosphodiesterase
MFDALRAAKLRRIIQLEPKPSPMYANRPLPDAISHRGLRASAPENTIPAFLAAIDAGADAIELDIHASLDGVIFVHHDAALLDETGGEKVMRPFVTTDSSAISRIRLAGDLRVPTLDETLEAIGTRAKVFIEIKARGIETDVARCLKRHFANAANYAVHSFDHRIVKRMLELAPSVRTGVLQVSYPLDSCAVMRAAGASDLWQNIDFVDSSLVVDVHACGGRVIVWTANEVIQWERLAAMGVDGICADNVDDYTSWRELLRIQD